MADKSIAHFGVLRTPMTRSLLRYSPALVLLAIVLADAGRQADPDLWGHIRFGQLFLANGFVPAHDTLSYSAPGRLWLNHACLGDAAMALIWNRFGVLGLKLFKVLLSVAVIVLLVPGEAATDAPETIQFAALLLAALALGSWLPYRPQVFDLVGLSAILAILSRHTYRGLRRGLWLIPAITFSGRISTEAFSWGFWPYVCMPSWVRLRACCVAATSPILHKSSLWR